MKSPFLAVAPLLIAGSIEPAEAAIRSATAPQGQRLFAPLAETRSIDGTGNNLANTDMGSTFTPFRRVTSTQYADGTGSPSGAARPSARRISNFVFTQSQSVPAQSGISDLFWQWGQFLDHDITETPLADPAEPFNIAVPTGDPWFDPAGTGIEEIPLSRSAPEFVNGVREQINAITSWIDASQVYGSDTERAEFIRAFDGSGRLKSSAGDLLPFNTDGLHNAPTDHDPSFFLAGDIRANEQVGLTALHTLWMREHNYWAGFIRDEDRRWQASGAAGSEPYLTGDEIYELARGMVSAEMQIITYREWLPILLGPGVLGLDSVYRPGLNAAISNEFATAAFRIGHTMLSSQLLRLDSQGAPSAEGHLSLADAFFAPHEITANGIDSVLQGLITQNAQSLDMKLIDDVRNLLFGAPGTGGLDLGSLNLQRGRDHGIASYSQARRDLGLGAPLTFADIDGEPMVIRSLTKVARTPEDLDLWVGGLSESPIAGGLVGETLHTLIVEQFEALRDGDRLWYSRQLPSSLVQLAEEQSMATVLTRNSATVVSASPTPFLVE